MLKFIALCLVLILSLPVGASTFEASSKTEPAYNWDLFAQQFDTSFWLSIPFATIWTHLIDTQLHPGQAANWSPILFSSVTISAINAYFYAQRVVEDERTRQTN